VLIQFCDEETTQRDASKIIADYILSIEDFVRCIEVHASNIPTERGVLMGKPNGRSVQPAKLVPGIVNRDGEHIELLYGDSKKVDPKDFIHVALVAPGPGGDFIVQLTVSPEELDAEAIGVIEETQKELNYFLIELGERDPWAYARYHCGTALNWYSEVHWDYYPKGWWRKDVSSSRTSRTDKTRSRKTRPVGQVRLVPGAVDRDDEHMELLYGETNELEAGGFLPVARVAPGPGKDFTVQYSRKLVSDNADTETRGMLKEVQNEIKFCLVELREPDPWRYARSHCCTESNLFRNMHWIYYPKKSC
jgi:hypothetical protein